MNDKAIVVITSFSIACAAFFASVVLLIPLIGSLLIHLGAPALLQQLTVLALLFGVPIIGALFGIDLGSRLAVDRSEGQLESH